MKITLRNPRKSSAYIFRIIYHYYKSPKFSKYFTRHPTGHHPMKRTTRPAYDPSPAPVVMVTDVYDRVFYVAKHDLENSNRILLPLYTKSGIKYTMTLQGEIALRSGKPTSIHRGNIKAIHHEN